MDGEGAAQCSIRLTRVVRDELRRRAYRRIRRPRLPERGDCFAVTAWRHDSLLWAADFKTRREL